MPEWIQDRLPKLELSLSNGYSWRSDLVLVYHELHGRHTATLYATDYQMKMWWRLRDLFTQEQDIPLHDILGWLPLNTLPDRPASEPSWYWHYVNHDSA